MILSVIGLIAAIAITRWLGQGEQLTTAELFEKKEES